VEIYQKTLSAGSQLRSSGGGAAAGILDDDNSKIDFSKDTIAGKKIFYAGKQSPKSI
jgi:hypothetical protein